MSINFEELDYQSTPIGDLMLRRRRTPMYGDFDIYEVKLGEDYLMTNLFNEAEIQLAKLGLAELDRDKLDVVVGGREGSMFLRARRDSSRAFRRSKS